MKRTENVYLPYVIEQTPDGERGYDLLSRLLKERIIYLFGPIDDGTTVSICGQLLFLDAQNKKEPINMYITSPGGVITSGMGVIDTMNMIKSPVHTWCIGQAASMGAAVLACGEKGSRRALPHSRILIHQPLGGTEGQASDIEIQAAEMKRVKEEMISLMASATGQSRDIVRRDTDRDNYMTAQEALKYGIIDEIAK